MELLNWEQRARSAYGCFGFVFVLVLAAFPLLALIEVPLQGWLCPGLFSAFFLFWCFSCIYGFVKNEVWRFGIRDDVIWWDSPRWPRSAGFIPLNDVCKVTIHEGAGRLIITARDGTSRRIPCNASRQVQAILNEHYPSVAIEFIEGT
jgi:hypothetical protein